LRIITKNNWQLIFALIKNNGFFLTGIVAVLATYAGRREIMLMETKPRKVDFLQ
jgi:hypothetical protein